MSLSLKNHPFGVKAHFDMSLVFTFAIPKEEVLPLIPECLELDTYNDKYAFIAVAMVQTKHLRHNALPKFMGNDFFLIGNRVFVKFTTSEGKRLRGLYILKSETNSKLMNFAGNIFTHYNYSTIDIEVKNEENNVELKSNSSGLLANVTKKDDAELPSSSPFPDWKTARRYAGPLPFTFTYNENTKEVLIIEGVRTNWKPKPVSVNEYEFKFIESFKFSDVKLANAFIIEDVPYSWKKGRIDKWKG